MVPEDKSTRAEEATVLSIKVIKLRRALIGPFGKVVSEIDTSLFALVNMAYNCAQV